MPFSQITVLGGGAWGTALAMNAVRAGNRVRVWVREPDVAESMASGGGNPRYLPGVQFEVIPTTTDLGEALSGCDAVMSVVPAQYARSVFSEIEAYLPAGTSVALCSKGVEHGTHLLMADVLSACLPSAIPAVLSGPSFAIDVANGLPTAVTLACQDEDIARDWMESIGRPAFRPYWTDDLVGAEVGGAVKNVLAIACGIVDGLELGRSAHAALISRGFAEMTRLGVALGARPETLAGLCGLGDLVLTCSSPQSRNMSFGRALGQGETVEAILAQREAVTEGVATAPGIVALARKNAVEMPICEAVAAILDGSLTVGEAMTQLMDRPFRNEKIL